MHRLLQRQIRKYLKDQPITPEMQALFEDVQTSYTNFDEDYKRLERILELSSQELFRANQLVSNEKEKIKGELEESYKKFEEFDKAVNSSFTVSVTDTEGIIISVNERFCATSGYSRNELLGQKHSIISSGYHDKKFWKELWHTLKSGKIWNGEIKNRRKNGEYYWEATNIIPFHNSLGEVYQFMAIKVDVTRRKNNEEEIKRLGLVAQKTLNAVILLDTEGNATWANEAFERITGYTITELQGRNPGDLLKGPGVNMDTVKKINYAIEHGKPFDGEILGYRKSGGPYWAALNISPLKDDEGHLTGFVALQNDITEKKNVEEELRVSEERWKYALTGNEDGVWDLNLETGVLFFSDSWKTMMGYTDNEVPHTFDDIKAFIHPDDFDEVDKQFAAYLSGRQAIYRNEYRLLTKGGNYKWILDRGKIIESIGPGGKKLRRFIGTHTDITVLKEAEEKERVASLIVKNSPTILVRWKPNFTLNIEYITENIANLGYNANEWIANQVAFTDFVHPDDLKPVTRKVIECFKEKIERVNLRYRMRAANGEYRWIDADSNIEWKAGKTEAAHFQGVLTDITEKVEAEEKLAENENRFRSLVQNSTDITTILDNQNRVVYESPSFYRTFGYTEEQVNGKNFFEFIHPDDIEKTRNEFFRKIERGGIADAFEFRIKHSNGRWVDMESTGNNQLNVPGIGGIVINSRDISDRKDAEAEMKELKNFYEVILNKIPSDVAVFDNKHRYLFVNERAVRDPEKRAFLIGHDDYDYCERYGRDMSLAHSRRAIFNKVVYSKQQIEFEEPFDTPQGRVWVLRRMYPLLDEAGELTHMIGFGLDITQRKLAEEKLKESQERLSLAINAAKLGIWDWNLETGALIWDKEMYTIFDINPNDFSGDYDAFDQTLHPDDKPRVFEEVQNTISGKSGDFSGTFRVLSRTGDVKYVAALSKLFRDETGKPTRMIGVNFNVTESKLAEQRILKSQAELEEAQHIARIGSWEIDMRTQTVTWSKEMRTIHEVPDDFVPALDNVHLFYTPETREAIVKAFKNALHEKLAFDIESKIKTADGTLLDVKTRGVPVIENGRVPYVKGIFQDISKEKEAERQLKEYTHDLERINKELDQFAYIVSHDLKAPLRAINNLSMWIEEDLEGKLEGETQYQFKLLRGRVDRMEDLINGILSYSRAGRVKANRTRVDILALVNGVLEMLAIPPAFKITIQEPMPVLIAEKIFLEQVFSNLISNAIKYNNNPQPEVNISCDELDEFYRFCVADNGQGIAPEYHQKIFVIFQTLEARDKVESTGVGLAIVQKIIEEKGGQVWVESEVGKGAKFFFTWPKQ